MIIDEENAHRLAHCAPTWSRTSVPLPGALVTEAAPEEEDEELREESA